MNPLVEKYLTPVNVVFGVAAVILVGLGVTCVQSSCGKKHKIAAVVDGVKADEKKKLVAEYEQQLAGKDKVIAERTAAALTYKSKLEAALKKIPVAIPAPVTESGLTDSMKTIGLRQDVTVAVAVPTVMNTQDATLVFNLDQQAKQAKAYTDALDACNGALKAQEAVSQAQTDALLISEKALAASKAAENARADQVKELTKGWNNEKAKGWQKYGMFALGVGVTLLVKK